MNTIHYQYYETPFGELILGSFEGSFACVIGAIEKHVVL